MKIINIGDQTLKIKDYLCDDGFGYINREDAKLWLYVNIADVCNGHCPFCINPCRSDGNTPFDTNLFKKKLASIKNRISGISLTGGEPMLFPELIDEIVSIISEVFEHSIEIDIVTNGFNFAQVQKLKHLDDFDSIHLSRHMISDAENNSIFGIPVATADEIRNVVSSFSDPAKVIFNCILMKDGISNVSGIAEFPEFAADVGVRNTSFIGMAPANRFCVENYVDPARFNFNEDARFLVWNRLCDHEYCRCSSGSYHAAARSVRFYYRCIGAETAPYARQLVYTADNRLLAGFGGKEIRLYQDEKI